MKKVNGLLVVVIASALSMLVGCKKEVVQTVDWYKAHAVERAEMLTKCRTNPGELASTPNCVNASRADSGTTWGATGGIKAPKPLTADEINKK